MSFKYNQRTGKPGNYVSNNYKGYDRSNYTTYSTNTQDLTWTRPSDWLAITPPSSSEQKVIMLIRVSPSNGGNYISFTIAGNYTVDWGDGTVENFSSGTVASHMYDYTTYDLTNTTLTTQGFKQAILTITPTGVANLTSLNFQTRHPSVPASRSYAIPMIELYVSCPNLTSFTLGSSSGSIVSGIICQYVNLINLGSITTQLISGLCNFYTLKKADITVPSTCTDLSNLFLNCYDLIEVNIAGDTSNVVTTSQMFASCTSLHTAPFFNTSNVTTANNMFNNCNSLQSVPFYNTAKVTNFYQIFYNAYSIRTVPLFNTISVTGGANSGVNSMFRGCISLITVPLFNLSNATYTGGMFSGCTSLKYVPLFNTANVTDMNQMFTGCTSLETVPLFNTSKVTSFLQMFYNCSSLRTVPKFDTNAAAGASLDSMFRNCYSLQSVPLFNTTNVTKMGGMFNNCNNLRTIPPFNTANVTDMNQTFIGCTSIKTIPLFNTSKVTNFWNMFSGCWSLQSIPKIDISAGSSTAGNNGIQGMFTNCYSLATIPADFFPVSGWSGHVVSVFTGCYSLTGIPTTFGSISATDASNAFNGCYSIFIIPSAFDTSKFTTMANTFNGCYSLISLSSLDVSKVTNFTSTFNTCYSLASAPLSNINASITFTDCALNQSALETVFNGLSTNGGGKTITITRNPGTIPLSSIASVSTTRGSLSATTTTAVATLSVGWYVTGTGTPLTTPMTGITFTDAGDLVTLSGHGLSDNDIISFPTITTTTGIVINTPYYVVNSTLSTFQVASSLSGAALPLTTNGTGTMLYKSTITSVVTGSPNTIVFSRPMTSTATNTLAFRPLDVGIALLKGWAVTG